VPSSFVVLTNYRQERTIKLSAACGLVSCQHLIVGPPKRDQAAPRWCLIFGPTFRVRVPETPPETKRCQHMCRHSLSSLALFWQFICHISWFDWMGTRTGSEA